MKAKKIGWDVDCNWHDRLAFPKFENSFRKAKQEVARKEFGFPPREYDVRLKHLKEENLKEYEQAILLISTGAQKIVSESLYMKDTKKRLAQVFKRLDDCDHYIISNGLREHVEELIDIFGIDRSYFKFMFTYETCRFHKPDVELFKKAISKSGAPPNQHVFVGDDYNNDIVPAKKAGMTTVLTWQEPPVREAERKPAVDRYARTVYEVPPIVRKL